VSSQQLELDAMVEALDALSPQELLELAKMASALEKRVHLAGPRTDDELHDWIHDHLKVDVPRIAVCADHCAPFDFLSDVYFERTLASIAMANRGGAKTFMCAIIHVLNGKFRPGVEMASVGAIEAQARRAYNHVLKLLAVEAGKVQAHENPDIEDSIMLQTRWRNGSRLEVLGGTKNAVNGPHPQKVHFDEVELADPVVFYESRNMSQSKDGVMAQDFITSTRKGAHGMMQKLIDECHEAERQGLDPPYKLYAWCVFETAARVDNCIVANPNLNGAKGCGCDRVLKGEWDDGTPRTFDTVCKGRLARSDGWIPLYDIHKAFRTNPQSVWEAQQECSRPSTEGLVIPSFTREKQGVRGFVPEQENGPIFMSIDWGGTNPFAVNWYQMLRYDVDVLGFYNSGAANKKLKEGTLVCFDEIYVAEISNTKMASMIVDREAMWKRQLGSTWHVSRRFCDPQGRSQRSEFADYSPPLYTTFVATRDVKEHIKKVKELFEDGIFAVDVGRCPMFCDEIEAWHYPAKRSASVDDPEIPVNDFDHCMANFRYAVANIYQLMKAQRRQGRMPRAAGNVHGTVEILNQQKRVIVNKAPGQYVLGPASRPRDRQRFEP
jgi:hypothetical protein